jgi:hypothetical protein
VAGETIDCFEAEAQDIPEVLERVMLYALKEAKNKLLKGDDVIPFTVIVVKENLFLENHPGDSVEECFADAEHTVKGVRGADAYTFCYDGYVETDAGTRDALIAEGGLPGEEEGIAICYPYTAEEGAFMVEEEPVYVGKAPNFM